MYAFHLIKFVCLFLLLPDFFLVNKGIQFKVVVTQYGCLAAVLTWYSVLLLHRVEYMTVLLIVKLVNLILFFVLICYMLPDVLCLVNKDFHRNIS